MLLSSSSVLEDFKTALDFFFRRRPTLASLMWHTDNIPAGQRFTVPIGKIYEVYILVKDSDYILLNSTTLLEGYLAYAYVAYVWYPVNGSLIWLFTNIDPATGDVSGGAINGFNYTLPQGWILSENDFITTHNGNAFRVRWRDVTHRQ